MNPLLPGFQDQLSARAEQLAAAQARRAQRPFWRRWWRGRGLAVLILLAGLTVGGGAYAGRGFWTPPIGLATRDAGVPTRSDLPTDQLQLLSVFQRDQSEADRGAASRYALQFNGGDTIRTRDIRLLTSFGDGASAVLIPVARRSSASFAIGDGRDLLCLWLRDPVGGGGVRCGTTGDLATGSIELTLSKIVMLSPQRRRAYDAVARRVETLARAGRGSWQLPAPYDGPAWSGVQRTVELVPDRVATVRLGTWPGSPTVAVHGNVLRTALRMPPTDQQVWLDREGHPVPKLGPAVIVAPWEEPSYVPPSKLMQRALGVASGPTP